VEETNEYMKEIKKEYRSDTQASERPSMEVSINAN
jgi:hypothetical protein